MNEPKWQPVIYDIELTPNPAAVGDQVRIQVKALDVFGGVQPEIWRSGEIQAGEV